MEVEFKLAGDLKLKIQPSNHPGDTPGVVVSLITGFQNITPEKPLPETHTLILTKTQARGIASVLMGTAAEV
jgi:hypothetical protein